MSLDSQSILIVGVGGIGTPAAMELANHFAGTIKLTVLDDDRVDATNLGRQMLFCDADTGGYKAELVGRLLHCQPLVARLQRDDASRELIRRQDIVLDCTDNFATRFAVNDLCVAAGVPFVHGAAIGWTGQVLTVLPGKSACLRCVFEREPDDSAPTCAQAGVITPLVGVVGHRMAQAAIEVLSAQPCQTADRMWTFDAWRDRERWAPVGRDPRCPTCGEQAACYESPGQPEHPSRKGDTA